jgi:hypothetical protein
VRTLDQTCPGEDVQLMKMMRRLALALAVAVLGAGTIGVSAPAHAYDTNWPGTGLARTPQR